VTPQIFTRVIRPWSQDPPAPIAPPRGKGGAIES